MIHLNRASSNLRKILTRKTRVLSSQNMIFSHNLNSKECSKIERFSIQNQNTAFNNCLHRSSQFSFSTSNQNQNPKDQEPNNQNEPKVQKTQQEIKKQAQQKFRQNINNKKQLLLKRAKAQIDYQKMHSFTQQIAMRTQFFEKQGYKINCKTQYGTRLEFQRKPLNDKTVEPPKSDFFKDMTFGSLNRKQRSFKDVRILFEAKVPMGQDNQQLQLQELSFNFEKVKKMAMLSSQIKGFKSFKFVSSQLQDEDSEDKNHFEQISIFCRGQNFLQSKDNITESQVDQKQNKTKQKQQSRLNPIDMSKAWLKIDVLVSYKSTRYHRISIIDNYEDYLKDSKHKIKPYTYQGIEMKSWSNQLVSQFDQMLHREGIDHTLLENILAYGNAYEHSFYIKWLQNIKSLVE